MKAKLSMLALLVILLVICTGCSQADTASRNLSRAADQFEVQRRIIFYNGITDTYIAVVEGLCSLGNYDATGELSVTCKVGDDLYVKHYLGLSDNVTYVCLQLSPEQVSAYHHRFIFRPTTLVPDLELDLQ